MDKLSSIQNKILDPAALLQHVHGARLKSKKIVFTNGVFDLLHRGHVTYLAQAAGLGNTLVVGLNSDASVKRLKGNERPLQTEIDRALIMASLLWVDAVCIFDEDTPLELIKMVMPDVLCKGGDYTLDMVVGAKEVLENGGKVEILPFENGYSTTGLVQKIK